MFFRLHKEGKIGYKKLSDSELGFGSSHQTHIGLFGDIFTFLSDTKVEEEALLIYRNNIDFIDCYFDRIENPDNSYRSPKIRKGNRNSISIVTVIRDKAKEQPDKNWYLIWFGLENERMVFYFFNNNSYDFEEISKIIDLSNNGRIEYPSSEFQVILEYLENKIDYSGQNILQELEIISQTERPTKRYRKFDLEKANELFKQTGELGEQLVANYLDYLKSKNQIFNFTWYNQSRETGLPYDFTVQENNQSIIYIDAKSTKYQFEQPMIFSSQEIEFIQNTPNYNIYRVFDLGTEYPKLKICEENKEFASETFSCISEFRNNLELKEILLKSSKMAIKPTNSLLSFKNNEIALKLS